VDAVGKFGGLGFLGETFSRLDYTFYRPLANVYFLLILKLFGMNALGFHVIVLLVHSFNSFLIYRIAMELTSDKSLGWMSAFLYASAITVHLDTLVWMVGFYDVAGVSFSLLSIIFFLSDRRFPALLAFCAALLTKESTVVVPFVLLALSFRTRNEKAVELRQAMKRGIPFIAVLMLFLAFRYQSIANILKADSNEYTLQFFGPSLFINLQAYARWISDSLVPVLMAKRDPWIFLVALGAILLTYLRQNGSFRMFSMLVVWLCVGIIPALLLQNHAYRYYLVYSLPAIVLLVSMGIQNLAQVMNIGQRQFAIVAAGLVLTNIVIAHMYLTNLEGQKLGAPTVDGSNNLLRKGLAVNMTKALLEREGHKLPHGATLLFDWVPTVSFGTRIGPGIWCNDTSIVVYEVIRDSTGMHLLDPTRPDLEPQIPSFDTGVIITCRENEFTFSRLSDF